MASASSQQKRSVSEKTLKAWMKDYSWLDYEKCDGEVVHMFCKLCTKHETKLTSCRNYEDKFIRGQ